MNKYKNFFMEISDTYNPIDYSFINIISKERKRKIINYQSYIDFKLGLYSELLIRLYICSTFNIKNDKINIQVDKYGKPFISNIPNIHFNISHTNNVLVVAFSKSNIGIDVEKINSFNFKIAERFFTVPERNYIINNSNQNLAFYEIWTKKEAYIKFTGLGLSKRLNSFNVLDAKLKNKLYTINKNNYLVSICSKQLSTPPNLISLNEDEFLKKISLIK